MPLSASRGSWELGGIEFVLDSTLCWTVPAAALARINGSCSYSHWHSTQEGDLRSRAHQMGREGTPCAAVLPLWVLLLIVTAASQTCPALVGAQPDLYGYEVVAEYPHDSAAFTQGLEYDKQCNATACTDILYESTGLNGESSVRIVTLNTGVVQQQQTVDAQWFGEGMAKLGERLYQVAWQVSQGFIYDAKTLKQVDEFKTPLNDGWGITTQGDQLVLSDGSSKLTWLSPDDLGTVVRSVNVVDDRRHIRYLNELELIEGEIWANVWQTQCIARIDPETGKVRGWVLMHGLQSTIAQRNLPLKKGQMDVLNGIAYDAERKRIFVTGKWWPSVVEIKPVPLNPHTASAKRKLSSCYAHSG